MIFRRGQLVLNIFNPSLFSALPTDFPRVIGRGPHRESSVRIDPSRTTERYLF